MLRFVIVLLLFNYVRAACNTFQNTSLIIKTDKGIDYDVKVNGCIKADNFGKKQVLGISVYGANIPKLQKGSVKDFNHLKSLTLSMCQINEINEGALQNVPKLIKLYLAKNNIKSLPSNVFNNSNIQFLYLDENQIDSIRSTAFENMTKLTEFHAAYNKITYYNRDWFANSPILRIIAFSYNKIRTIPHKAFWNNKKLEEIHLQHNDIDNVEESAFDGLSSLKYLDLRYNNLRVLTSNIIPTHLSIETLLISANKFNYLPEELLKKLSVKYLNYYGNPWKCCCIFQIDRWILLQNGTVESPFPGCNSSLIPICTASENDTSTCSEIYDQQATARFYTNIQKFKNNVPYDCVRFD